MFISIYVKHNSEYVGLITDIIKYHQSIGVFPVKNCDHWQEHCDANKDRYVAINLFKPYTEDIDQKLSKYIMKNYPTVRFQIHNLWQRMPVYRTSTKTLDYHIKYCDLYVCLVPNVKYKITLIADTYHSPQDYFLYFTDRNKLFTEISSCDNNKIKIKSLEKIFLTEVTKQQLKDIIKYIYYTYPHFYNSLNQIEYSEIEQ